MSRGVCLVPDCKWKHRIPEELKKAPVPAQAHMFHDGMDAAFGRKDPQVNLGIIGKQSAIINEFNTNKELEGKVLLDTGANEVVRSFSYYE